MSTAQAGQPRSLPDQAPPFTSSLVAFNLRAEIARHNKLASEAVANARAALQSPRHDTLLGRQHYELTPLPVSRRRSTLTTVNCVGLHLPLLIASIRLAPCAS